MRYASSKTAGVVGWEGPHGPDGDDLSLSTETLNEIAGNSSAPTDTNDFDLSGSINTINTESDDTTSSAGTDTGAGKAGDEGGDAGKGGEEGDDKLPPFHTHPRWQEMVQKQRDAELRAATLEAENRILKDVAKPPAREAEKAPTPPAPGYRDITTMSPEDIEAAMRDDPKGFAANMYLQIRTEAVRDIQAAQEKMTHEEKVRAEYAQFEKDNPEFKVAWESGEVRAFMDTHSGHNPMSAYLLMTLPQRIETAKKEAAEAARKEAEENLKAKTKATTLSGSSSGVPKRSGDEALKDTAKSGGLVHSIAGRLAAMRKASGG